MQRYFGIKKDNNYLYLLDSDYHHIKNVMRNSDGDLIEVVVDGKLYLGCIENVNKNISIILKKEIDNEDESIPKVNLIISLLKVPGFDPLKTFLIFFIPASICLFIDVILFYLRSRQLMKYLQNEKEIVANAETKMAELRKRYGNEK